MPSSQRWRSPAYSAGCIAALAAFVVAVHAPVERADFSLDDYDYIAGNQSIRSFATAFAAFARPFPPHMPEKSLYRPVTNLTYAVDFALWRDSGWGYHATNVAVYVLVVALVFALSTAYTGSRWFALAVGLLFAAHPVHCEAVDSVTGRSEMLSLGFALVSLLLFLRAMRRGEDAELRRTLARASPGLAGSALAYALSALSKETGAILPAVLAVHFLVYGRRVGEDALRSASRCAAFLAPHGLVAAGYLAMRFHALGAFTPPSAAGGWLNRSVYVGLAFFYDLRLLIWPIPSHVDFYWESRFLHLRESALPFLLGCLLLGFTLRTLIDWMRQQIRNAEQGEARKIEVCALATFLAFLFPASHILPIGVKMAERLLFAPSLGFCLFVAIAAREWLRRHVDHRPTRDRIAALLVTLIAVAGGVRSHQRALEWRDDLRLWLAEDRALPGDPRVLANLAIAYHIRGRWEESRDALDRARRYEMKVGGMDAQLDRVEQMLRRSEHLAP
jgi:hypothetical protein